MSTSAELLAEAVSASKSDSKRSESLYKQILSSTKPSTHENSQQTQTLRDQETALVNLGQLYRDQKYVDLDICYVTATY